jgi:iron(III) transport system substrate-binding protein
MTQAGYRIPSRARRAIACTFVLALAAAACGDDDDEESNDAGTVAEATVAEGTTEATATEATASEGTASDGTASEGTTADGGGTVDVETAAAEAEELGLNFVSSHDEIVAKAQEEGKVVIQSTIDDFAPFEEAFEAEFPGIDMEWFALSGTDTERFLLEVESGAAQRYDVGYPAPEAYNEIADMFDWDLYGMAQAGVIDLPLDRIDAERRTVVTTGDRGVALAYNSDLVDEADLPTSWDELIDPRWGRDQMGMAMDVDLNNVSVLATSPDWGIERVVELSEQMAELDPIYTDGHTAASLLVQQGEVAISPFVNVQSAQREIDKDPDGPLQLHFVEPVPVRASEAYGIYNDDLGEAPHAGLLFIEWMANSDVAQSLLDENPVTASMAWPGSRLAEMTAGLEITVAGPGDTTKLPGWIEQIHEAFGFPTL